MIAKISLAISALLAIAVVYLLVKKPSSGYTEIGGEVVNVAPALQQEGGPKPIVLAYVNGDSLNAKYRFIVEKTEQLEKNMNTADKKVEEEYHKRELEAQKWANYLQQPGITEAEKMEAQQDIIKMENEMAAIQERERGKVEKKKMDLQKDLNDKVTKFLEVYSKKHGLDYVVNHQSSFQFILYGNNAYDITNEVVAGLNAEYDAEQKK